MGKEEEYIEDIKKKRTQNITENEEIIYLELDFIHEKIAKITDKITEIQQNIEYLLEILECYAQAFQNLCEKLKTYNF